MQKLSRGSQITALRLQGVPVIGDNTQPRMNLPSLLHRTAPICHQMALCGYDRGKRSWQRKCCLCSLQGCLVQSLALSYFRQKNLHQVEVKLKATVLISPHSTFCACSMILYDTVFIFIIHEFLSIDFSRHQMDDT